MVGHSTWVICMQQRLIQRRRGQRGTGLALAATAALLTACTMPTRHSLPTMPPLPAQWDAGQGMSSTTELSPWWLAAGDDQLSALITEALARNRDVARSVLRLRQAGLATRRSEQDQWPQPSLGLSAGAQRPLQNTGPSSVVINGVSVPLPASSGTSTNAGLSLSASYELDLWGRVADSVTAADHSARASAADLDAARWLLTTQVAEQYWTLAASDAKRPLLQAQITDAQASLAAAQLRVDQGKARPLEADRASAALADARLRLQALDTQRSTAQRALAVLLDVPPQQYAVPAAQLPAADPAELPAATPTAVLDRRPDLRSARHALDAALAKLNIAEANRYPTVRLSATLGSGGNGLGQWLSNPVGSLGAALALPMVDWERLRIERNTAQLQLDDAAVAFRDSLYRALAEVDNQLAQRQQLQAELPNVRDNLAQADKALAVARLRHAAGADALQTVRDADQARRDAQAALLDLRLKAWLNQLAVHKALGGPLSDARHGSVAQR